MQSHISKVKVTTSKVAISSTDATNRGENVYTSPDRPLPEFEAALQRLKETITDVLMLERKYADGLIVKGVTWKETGKKTGVILTATKMLEEGGMTFNTPVVPFDVFDTAELEILDEIKAHAMTYLAGKRAQQEMFTEADSAQEPAASAEEVGTAEVTPTGKIETKAKRTRAKKPAKVENT